MQKLIAMKAFAVVALGAALTVVRASPHHHPHRHVTRAVDKRVPEPVIAAVYVPGPVETIIVYELNGQPISEDEVRQGIANGTLVWGDDGVLSSSFAQVPEATPTPTSGQALIATGASMPSEAPATTVSQITVNAASSSVSDFQSTQATPSAAPSAPLYNGGDGACTECDKEFPSDQLSCNSFPLGYGAVPMEQEGLGGWSGIQDPQVDGSGGYDDITTVPSGSCSDGSCCTPGSFCAYACPNPYLKAAFPKTQGATGQSVGGIYCNANNKLEMPDGSLAKTLCMRGTDKGTVLIENKLSNNVSICRTDYPGTESMTIPFTIAPGDKAEIAVVQAGQYYQWKGLPTSSQYYVNNQGIPEDQACTWGDGSKAQGNWSPLVLGAGWDDKVMNMGFISLDQNSLTSAKLNYNIAFTGENDNLINPCTYNAGTGQVCNENNLGCIATGCTATLKSGTLTIVLSD